MPPQDRRERVVHLSDGHIELDEGTAVRHGQSIEFTRTEWRLLKFLHEQAFASLQGDRAPKPKQAQTLTFHHRRY